VPPEEVVQVMAKTPPGEGGPVPDLLRWYVLDPGSLDAQAAVALLTSLPFVTQAAVQRTPHPAGDPAVKPGV
jgi:hypothetical protein